MTKIHPKALVVAGGGGHLNEALLATEGVPLRRVFMTCRLPHTETLLHSEMRYYVIDPHTSIWKYGLNALQSMWIVMKERPQLLINTGGGITIAASLLGKFMGAKLIVIESCARVTTPSRTARFLYKYADLFIIQWKPLQKYYTRSVYGGPLL